MFQVKAMVHSLKAQDEVTILHENGSNDVIAEYRASGVRPSLTRLRVCSMLMIFMVYYRTSTNAPPVGNM